MTARAGRLGDATFNAASGADLSEDGTAFPPP